MHNLQLTEDQEMVVDTVRKLVADTVAPKVQELDEHRTFVRDWFDALAELGVYGLDPSVGGLSHCLAERPPKALQNSGSVSLVCGQRDNVCWNQ